MKRVSSTIAVPDRPFVKRPHPDQAPFNQQKNDTIDQTIDQQQAEAEKIKLAHQRMKYDVNAYSKDIRYSPFYKDDTYQYRHITLPPQIAAHLPDKESKKLLRESEFRRLGVSISSGWEHYMIYQPESNILLLRRSHELTRKMEAAHKAHLQQKKDKEAAAALLAQKVPTRRRITTKADTAAD